MLNPRRFVRATSILVLALAATQSNLRAQQRVRTGLTGGVVSSTLDSPDANSDRRTAFAAGLAIDLPFSPSLSFLTGVTYEQKGATGSDATLDLAAAIELAYLQIPAMLRYQFPGAKVRPFIEGGGAFALRLSCTAKASAGGFSVSGDCADVPDESGPGTADPVEKTDVSALVGAGVDLGKWAAGIRYDHGLTNLDKTGTSTVKNRAFLLSVTYWFGK